MLFSHSETDGLSRLKPALWHSFFICFSGRKSLPPIVYLGYYSEFIFSSDPLPNHFLGGVLPLNSIATLHLYVSLKLFHPDTVRPFPWTKTKSIYLCVLRAMPIRGRHLQVASWTEPRKLRSTKLLTNFAELMPLIMMQHFLVGPPFSWSALV